MPGLNLYMQNKPIDAPSYSRLSLVVEKMRHTPQYSVRLERPSDNVAAAMIAYPGYPIVYKRSGSNHFFLEGFIYGQDQRKLDNLLQEIADALERD